MAKAEPRRDIKAEILAQARMLFNEHGFMNVSMRDIADSLHISVGNLTYHFRRKEELIMAVANGRGFGLPPQPHSIKQLDTLLRQVYRRLHENSFLYCQQRQLAGISGELLSFHNRVMELHRQYILSAIGRLQAAGLVRQAEYEHQYEQLADAIHIVCIHWLPHNAHRAATEDGFAKCVWSMVYPFLTKQGQTEYISL